ncbi:malonyl-CoA decarboxylase [Microvirga massiliensis]|uniref:malonyl-CoA decarboxylase n=1 Tax=Microvirga massiliensis TaxID=1033741 RepID=UPI00062B43C8|nr:malonyl-CoA decarboxylase [Microvirga massiliensis]
MSTSFFQDMLGSIAERGRYLLDHPATRPVSDRIRRTGSAKPVETIETLSRSLLSGRGEASGVALARQVLDFYASLPVEERIAFFRLLARDFGPDQQRLRDAWSDYDKTPTPKNLQRLLRAVEPPRQELFRRLNLAPGGTGALVTMRQDLLEHGGNDADLASVDDDLVHLLYSWFNRGFLMMRRITWSSPADILERIIRYEAVHTIQDWDDLRRRVQPPDRRCYAFFHPSLFDEPLIFVEVALTKDIPSSIQEILADGRKVLAAEQATTAVFYSISNCQPGLRGISFGNFLIKQVVEDLSRDLPSLKTFVTLSPAPGFGRWLERIAEDPTEFGLEGLDTAPLALLENPDWHRDTTVAEQLWPLLMSLAAAYYLRAKTKSGQPLDPVARFHLGNGARLERLNWLGDTSAKGVREAAGLMVNYLYDLNTIEANHEAYANQGMVAAAHAIQRQIRDLTSNAAKEARHV